MALTMSLLLFFRARTAFARETLACDMTSSMSLTSTPVSSTCCQKTELAPLKVKRARPSPWRQRLTSSSSLSSCTVGVCVFSWMLDTASPWTLNFSAAASWACWERSSIWRNNQHSGREIFHSESLFLEEWTRLRYLSFTKDDVCVWRGALVDVWFSDDEQDVLRFANCDSRHPRDLSETELWHCLGQSYKKTM